MLVSAQTTPTIRQVLGAGNNANGKSLIGASLIGLNGATSGTVTIAPPAIVTTYTFALPANDGGVSQFLQTDGSGTTSWQTALTGLVVGSTAITSGTVGRVFFEGAGNVLQQDGSFFWDNTNKQLGIGTSTPIAHLDVKKSGNADTVFRFSNDIVGGDSSMVMLPNGRVGIGTLSPESKFEIEGDNSIAVIDGAGGFKYLYFKNGATTYGSIGQAAFSGYMKYGGDRHLFHTVDETTGSLVYQFYVQDNSGVFQVTNASGSPSFFTGNYPAFGDIRTGIKTSTPASALDVNGILTVDSLQIHAEESIILDDGSISIAASQSGWGEVFAFNSGTFAERARFYFNSDASVVLIDNSANVVTTDTDTNLCIFDNGTSVSIRNRLGGTRTLKVVIHY